MKVVKIILSITLCATVVLGFISVRTQNYSGRYSSVSVIGDEEREWILERFGRPYESIEEYISTAQNYARANFKYDYDKVAKPIIFQHYDFQSICKGDEIRGICFDFSVLFKNMTLVLTEAGYLPVDARVFVVDIAYQDWTKPGHSFNVVSLPSGDKYYLCLTTSATRAEKGLEPTADYEIFRGSIEAYCKKYKERVTNLH